MIDDLSLSGDENDDLRKSLSVIGGRKGEIDIPATSLDWMSWNNPAIVSTAEYDWTEH